MSKSQNTPAAGDQRPIWIVSARFKNNCTRDLEDITFRIEVFTVDGESFDNEEFTLKGALPAESAKGIL